MKALALKAFREGLWLARAPLRSYRNATLDKRLPSVQGRTWRSGMPPFLIRSIMRGTLKYHYNNKQMLRHPMDLALILMLLQELKPQTIIEIGCKYGGTSEWLYDVSGAQVWAIDIDPPLIGSRIGKTGVIYYKGNEARLELLDIDWKTLPSPWLVINDASHHPPTMLPGLRFLESYMQVGDYMIIEDGFLSEMGTDKNWGGGPAQAIVEFLKDNPRWKIDAKYCDMFGYNVTGNPNGYLRCVS